MAAKRDPKATKVSGRPNSPSKVTKNKKVDSARARIPRAAKTVAVKKAAEPTLKFTVKAAKKKTVKNLAAAKIPAARKPTTESPFSRVPAEKHEGPPGGSKRAVVKKTAATKAIEGTKSTAKKIVKKSTTGSKAGRPKKAAAATSGKSTGKKAAGRPKKAATPPRPVDDRDNRGPRILEGGLDEGDNFIPFGGIGVLEILSGKPFTSPPKSPLFGGRARTPTSPKKSPPKSPGKGSPGRGSPGKGSPGKALPSPKKSPKKS